MEQFAGLLGTLLGCYFIGIVVDGIFSLPYLGVKALTRLLKKQPKRRTVKFKKTVLYHSAYTIYFMVIGVLFSLFGKAARDNNSNVILGTIALSVIIIPLLYKWCKRIKDSLIENTLQETETTL